MIEVYLRRKDGIMLRDYKEKKEQNHTERFS